MKTTKKRKLLTAIVLAASVASPVSTKAQVIINELMQSNIDCVMDDINEFPDSWVELYNSGTTSVNLNQYAISDKDNPDKAWKLPGITLKPGKHILVYCDKEEKDLHTHFRLESGKGCNVYLFNNGNIIDKVEGLKKQPAPNIAYGRKTDGSDTWGYMATPTPAATNCGETCKDILGSPVFSEKGRVMKNGQAFKLKLSLPEGSEGAEIRYTTNGSEPTRTSYLYSTPININKTTVVKAKLFQDGKLSPRSSTQSYIFFPRDITLPVISISTDDKYFYDNKIGIYVDGTYQSGKKNYEFDWQRPTNIEFFFEPEKESQINQLCETRIMGGATRGNKMKSLAVYANKRFGEKRLDYEFFPDQRPGVTDFKSIALRNAGNDFDYLYLRDAIIQSNTAKHVDIDYQAWRPAIVYINGQYTGMLNIRERSNEDNIYTNYDGLEDLDMFENWGELKEGSWDNYNAFKAFYTEHGHTLAEYNQWMDTMEFLNLMLVNLFYNNRDFPGNNIVMWRPTEEGGRWRWIMKDTDFGLGLYGVSASFNTIKWIYDPNYDPGTSWANQYDHTRLFRRLMEDIDFKREFIDRAAIYMGDWLNSRGTFAVWNPMYDMIKYEYPYHRKLVNQWWPNYTEEMNNARNWIANRPTYFYKYIAEYYKLGTPLPLTVNKAMDEIQRAEIEIEMNGVKLSEALFDGKFFKDRRMTITGSSLKEGYTITGWKITTTDNSNKQTTEVIEGAEYSFLMPSCRSIAIEAIIGEDTGINGVKMDSKTAEHYNLKGVRTKGTNTPEIIISRQGKKSRKNFAH
ncbi:MAG: CotH kinase family protein [Prevotella sp.]